MLYQTARCARYSPVKPDYQRRAAHHEPHVRRVRERIPAADLVGGPAVGEPQIDAVLDAELHLTAIDERQHRAGAGVRLYDHLVTGRATHHLGDAAGEREVHGSGRVGADGDRFGQRALRGGADGERTGGEGHDESKREQRAAHRSPRIASGMRFYSTTAPGGRGHDPRRSPILRLQSEP